MATRLGGLIFARNKAECFSVPRCPLWSLADIATWHDLYVMLGTSSAALIGLLFVATSLHLGEVVSNPGFRVRSYNQTVYLLTLVVEAVLILVPQPVPFLGAELMVLNLVGLWLPISTSYTFLYKQRDNSHRGGMKMSRAITLSGAYLLGIAGGIALIQGSHWGMYIVPVSYTTLLVTVVLGAWSTMLGIEQRQLAALAFCDPDVRLGSLADISQCNRHVRFVPIADIRPSWVNRDIRPKCAAASAMQRTRRR